MILFGVTFISVFLLVFQQQNVIHEKYVMAMFTSFLIAFSQFVLFREAVVAGTYEWIYMGFGGSLGVISSMKTHKIIRSFYG